MSHSSRSPGAFERAKKAAAEQCEAAQSAVSPYLLRPLRTMVEAMRDFARQAPAEEPPPAPAKQD